MDTAGTLSPVGQVVALLGTIAFTGVVATALYGPPEYSERSFRFLDWVNKRLTPDRTTDDPDFAHGY
ncbi:hypothetical protein [Streptomyces sp. NPDC059271]|uniref:hypothetical protein n=1 Tax=unclassified Streptomyces TaxID=2593676 RepID=UPI00369ED05C